MRNYSWSYGIFHWFVHYVLATLLWWASGLAVFPITVPVDLFGIIFQFNIADYFMVFAISSLIDLDHVFALRKFGFKRYIWTEKRVVAPLHNFFFLSVLSSLAAFSAIFISPVISVLLLAVVLHIIWDISEDVFIFRTSFRRWEKTWGLKKEDLEQSYNELMQIEATQPKKEPRLTKVRKLGAQIRLRQQKLNERIRRKKKAPLQAEMT